jgi:hypothetical protein
LKENGQFKLHANFCGCGYWFSSAIRRVVLNKPH